MILFSVMFHHYDNLYRALQDEKKTKMAFSAWAFCRRENPDSGSCCTSRLASVLLCVVFLHLVPRCLIDAMGFEPSG